MTTNPRPKSAVDAADFVIIGGGSAGAIVARRLADAGADVLLIEAGPTAEFDDRVLNLDRQAELFTRPFTSFEPGGVAGYGAEYPVTIEGRGNENMYFPTALMLGGGSSHNDAIVFHAPDWDGEAWERAGATGWGPRGTALYIDRVRGRIHTEEGTRRNALAQAFLDATGEMAVPFVDLAEVPESGGAGWFRYSKRGSRRQSSSVAYLFPLAELPANLRVRAGTRVRRVILDETHVARGVETDAGVIEARREVIVSAGAFGSPKLLLLSGIGPGDELEAAGVPALVDVPGVGRHLLDHPAAMMMFEADRDLPDEIEDAVAFLDLGEPERGPDAMVECVVFPYDVETEARGYPTSPRAFGIAVAVTQARSEGVVRLRSADPDDDLYIDPRYLNDSSSHDERVLLGALRWARAVVQQQPLSGWVQRELAPGSDVTGDEALIDYALSVSFSSDHPSGTCKMGSAEDPLAVLDENLRVRGVERLRVADASVFPCIPTANINMPCMMVGEKAADLILR
jgi:choline dehydrogenase-like flavoprotein